MIGELKADDEFCYNIISQYVDYGNTKNYEIKTRYAK